MVNNEYELRRTDSVCPTPEELLLRYTEENEEDKIRKLVQDNPAILSHIYDYPYYRPILHICCTHFKETVQPRVIEELINLGADIFFSQEHDDYKEALHFAAESTRPVILERIVKHVKRHSRGNINVVDKHGNTALITLIKSGETDGPNFLTCAKILVENGINVNKADIKNQTAILLASRKGYRDIVKLLLKQPNIDLDTHKLRGKSARQWIVENQLDVDTSLPGEICNNNLDLKEVLFGYLKEDNERDFINFPAIANVSNKDDGCNTLLQLACTNGQINAVRYLLQNGADPNLTTPKNRKFPIEIVSERGYFEIFEELIKNQKTRISNNVVCNLLKHINQEKLGAIDYEKCYNLLRENITNINLNEGDASKNTPLHYAIAYATEEEVLKLLDMGASLATKNEFGISPVHDISPDMLEKHLDNCMQLSNKNDEIRENCVMSFNYRTLVPPQKEKDEADYDMEKNPLHEVQELIAETEVICYMSKSKELKHLLKHPVISSFLFMKWHKMRWFFYTNLAFYITFALSLILYVLVHYNQQDGKDTPYTAFSTLLTCLLCVSFVVLVLREAFQFLVSPKTYISSFENWMEIFLIGVTFSILIAGSHSEDTRKQLSAVAVLLATFEFVLLVGQHPKICTNVVMLRTVSHNFFKFLLWFSILILAFAFSFYVLFNNNSDNSSPSNKTSSNDQDFFSDPGLSIIKTIVMLTGEFDAGSINFQTFPLTSRLIFLMFVFMIAIILFNLLNGLAVSDTQVIQSDAELVSLIARADHIRYIENMILGNLCPSSVINIARKVCCCIPIQTNFNITVPKSLAKRICLFPHYLPNYSLQFYPMKRGEIIFQHDTLSKNSCWKCSRVCLDNKTVRNTMCKLQERNKKIANLETIILNLQKSVEELRREQNRILEKLQLTVQ